MSSTLQQTIHVQITGTAQMASAINGLIRQMSNYQRSAGKSSKATGDLTGSMTRSAQGIANIQAGLVQLSTYLLNMKVGIDNVFDKMSNRFMEAQDAITQLKITMGLASLDPKQNMGRFEEFEKFKATIDEIALSTEYTKKQVADAFDALIVSGRDAKEAMDMLRPALAFSTATGGAVDLAEAINITTLTLSTLGGRVEDTKANLNMLMRASQKTKIGFGDLDRTLSSLRSSFASFKDTDDREAELVALAAASRNMGLSAAESGEKVKQFSSILSGLMALAMRGEFKDQFSLSFGKKPTQRFNIKRQSLLNFFGIERLSLSQLNNQLGENFGKVRQAQDEFLKRQFSEFDRRTGQYGAVSITKLVDTLGKAFEGLKRGSMDAKGVVKGAFGQEAAVFLIDALVSLRKEGETVGQSFENLVKLLREDKGDLDRAQAEALKTLSKRTQILEGAIDSLSNTIFEQDVVQIAAIDTYKEMVVTVDKLMKGSQTLASSVSFMGRSLQFLTTVGTNLGFALVAAATFSVALTHSGYRLDKGTQSLGKTMRAFGSKFLAPTFLVVKQMTGGLFLMGAGIVALMKYFSNGEGVGKGFEKMLRTVADSVKFTSALLSNFFGGKKNLSSSEIEFIISKQNELVRLNTELAKQEAPNGSPQIANELKVQIQNILRDLKRINNINERLGSSGQDAIFNLMLKNSGGLAINITKVVESLYTLGSALRDIASGMIGPLMSGIGFAFEALFYAIKVVLSPVRALAKLFGLLNDGGNETSDALFLLGRAIGSLLVIFGAAKIIKMFIGMLDATRSKLKGVGDSLKATKFKVDQYKQGLSRTSHTINTLNNSNRVQISRLDQLKLHYYKATGQINKFNAALVRANNRTRGVIRSTNGLSSKLGGIITKGGLVAGTLLTAADMSGFLSEGMSQIVNVGFILIPLFNMIGLAGIKAAAMLVVSFLPFIAAILAVVVALDLLYSLMSGTESYTFKAIKSGLSFFTGDDEKVSPATATTPQTSVRTQTVTPTTSSPTTVPTMPTNAVASSEFTQRSSVDNRIQATKLVINVNGVQDPQRFATGVSKIVRRSTGQSTMSGVATS